MSISRIIRTRRRITVQPWESAAVLLFGAITRVEGPGRHRRRRHEEWFLVDTRATWLALSPQEVLTSDGVPVRITPVVRHAVADAARWLANARDAEAELYTLAQLGVRDAIVRRTAEEVLAARDDLLADTAESLVASAADLGIEVSRFEVRDVTLSGELRRAIAETALAREEGRAKLERARAESAALRSLANTAQLLDAHPSLLQLRAIESASAGGSLVVHVSAPERTGD